MDWIIELDICALLITSLILLVVFQKKDLPTMKNITFGVLMILTFLASLFDLVSVYCIENVTRVPLWLNYILQMMYSIPFTAIPMVYYIYVMSLTIQSRIVTKSRIALIVIPYAIELLLVLTTPFTHWHFHFNDALQYTHGWAVYVTYGLSFFYIILCFIDVAQYKKRLTLMQITTIMLICFACAAAVFVQLFFNNLLLVCFVVAFSSLVACFTIQNSNRGYNAITGTFTLKSFEFMLLTLFRKKKNFTVFCLEPKNYSRFYETLDVNALEELAVYTAGTIRTLARGKEVYRLSTFRFALIWDTPAEELQSFVSELTEQYQHPFRMGTKPIYLTPVMCTVQVPEAAGYLEDVMSAIHNALEQAQQLDRSDVNLVRSDEAALIRRRREIAISHVLKRAIQREEFIIHYQPIYSARERRYVAAEALLRLSEKSLGDIPPSEFIPIAEKLGIMPQISRIVLEQVCAFIADNRLWEKGIRHIGINLTSPDCINELLPTEATRIMDRYHIPCNMINFEVTETAIHDLLKRFPDIVGTMSSLGTNFTLDAFYSSASESLLLGIPFRQVKLSKTFLDSSMNSESNRIFLKHTISLFRDLNLEIVAVGIETKEQMEELSLYGCHYYQGFFYSTPLPEKDLLTIFH